MIDLQELDEINEYIKEYFSYYNMNGSIEKLEEEIKTKQLSKRFRHDKESFKKEEPRLHFLFKNNEKKNKNELNLIKNLNEVNKKHKSILQGARQIFSVSINFIQNLMGIKEVMSSENTLDLLDSYKIQLGKYHKVVMNDGKLEGNDLLGETVMQEHKQKFLKHLKDNNTESLVEVLLSLRVNALQIAPELRKNLVYELIRNDIFNIESEGNFNVLTKILSIENSSLKHAITSLISVISSTLKGVEYLTSFKNMVVIKSVIKILKKTEDGSVTQRFCIAILQKCSIKETVIPTMLDNDMIYWIIDLLNKSLKTKINVFCLDFSSALLANIVHSKHTISFLENNIDLAKQILKDLLTLMNSKIPVSVLMHILISISYLSKDNFSKILEEVKFVDKISQFVEYYSQINTIDNEALEIDKKTVLDLCAHMFHPKDASLDNSESMEGMDLNSEDRIREYENEQGELIFECFQDEVS